LGKKSIQVLRPYSPRHLLAVNGNLGRGDDADAHAAAVDVEDAKDHGLIAEPNNELLTFLAGQY
jgi:hypothetical protein